MKKQTIRDMVIEKASSQINNDEISDYKDFADALSSNIGDILLLRPRIASLFEDMPDGFQCPQGFSDWLNQRCC